MSLLVTWVLTAAALVAPFLAFNMIHGLGERALLAGLEDWLLKTSGAAFFLGVYMLLLTPVVAAISLFV